ncbi:aspartate--tRNA ligase dps1 [Hypoxylon texense]
MPPSSSSSDELPTLVQQGEYDVLILGTDILACVLAITLARQGRRVALILRDPGDLNGSEGFADELLHSRGVAALSHLGLESCLEGIDACPVAGYRISYHGDVVTLLYPPVSDSSKNSRKQDGPQRPEGRSFHHRKFLMKLREAARREQNIRIVPAKIRQLLWSGSPRRVVGVRCLRSAKGRPFICLAPLAIITDRQASNFRSRLLYRSPYANAIIWGSKLVDTELASASLPLWIIDNGGPVLIYQIGERKTRIVINVSGTHNKLNHRYGGIAKYVRSLVIPTLPATLRPAVEKVLATRGLDTMPETFLPASESRDLGVAVLGDAINMRLPLAGAGMTVALNDVVLLSQLLSPEQVPSFNDTVSVSRQMQEFHRKRKANNASLYILAQALYALFIADDPLLQVLQRGFMKYIKHGGKNVEELSGLMGGVYHSPFLLFYHLFAIAFYSLWLLLCEQCAHSIWRLPVAIIQCLLVFGKAVKMIAPYILAECLS